MAKAAVDLLAPWCARAADDGDPDSAVYFNPEWRAEQLEPYQVKMLPEVVATVEGSLRPPAPAIVANREEGGWFDRLLILGGRIQPTGMEVDQAVVWAAALLQSLAHHPSDLIDRGLVEVERRQFRFLNEVGPAIEAVILPEATRRRIMAARLRQIEEVAKRRRPPPAPGTVDTAAILAQVAREKGIPVHRLNGDAPTAKRERGNPAPPGGWNHPDPWLNHHEILVQVDRQDRMRQKYQKKPAMTGNQRGVTFEAIKERRVANGYDPAKYTADGKRIFD